SLNYKLCRLGIGGRLRQHLPRNQSLMVPGRAYGRKARKLQEIDGKAPP
ncbi:unnamed protein product, partial [Laminaria digitata]